MSTASADATAWEEAPRGGRGDACPGSLRLHTAEDGALARIRVPGGALTALQARTLADASRQLADGELHLTSRGNVQLRGLAEGGGGELAARLTPAGLLPSPLHERIRNIVASPLAGLDGRGHGDLGPWLRELDALLCAGGAVRKLSGRFLFALDDGRGDVAALAPDVTLLATGRSSALLRVGTAGSVLALPADAAAPAAVTAAEAFLDAASAIGSGLWRVRELPRGPEELTREVAQRLADRGVRAPLLDAPPPPPADGSRRPLPGLVTGPDGRAALTAAVPLGTLTAAQWLRLADLAEREGRGELRLTPWRQAVVPGLAPDAAHTALAALAAGGLATTARSPWLNVGACIGRPGCGKSLADVRADAAAALGTQDGPPVHWSGCERRCGRPRGDGVDMVATPEGYDIFADGRLLRSRVPSGPRLAAEVAAARTRSSGR